MIMRGLFVNNFFMDKLMLPLPNGVVAQSGDKKVLATISADGKKRLQSFKENNKVIFFDFPFARGVQFFFFGIYALICEFFRNEDIFDRKQKNKKNQQKTGKIWLFFALCLIFGLLFGLFGLFFAHRVANVRIELFF